MHMNDNNFVQSITSLRKSIDRSNSLKWAFLLGVVRGIGAVIGATLLAGIALGVASYMFDQVSDIPFVGQYFADLSESLEEPPAE